MKTILIACALSFFSILLIPSSGAGTQKDTPQNRVLIIAQEEQATLPAEKTLAAVSPQAAAEQDECPADEATILVLSDGEAEQISAEEYLAAVVLCEMPVSFETEALKAQAVAARTFLWKQAAARKHENADVCGDSACCQAWLAEEQLRQKFGSEFDAAWGKALTAVRQTQNEVLCYDGALIDATYFSCSGGSTEAAVAVWGTDVPYLQAVESPGEENAARYESEAFFSFDDFRSIICAEEGAADLSASADTWLGKVTYTEGGGVSQAVIGGAVFTGTQLRRLFGLNSTRFTMKTEQSGVRFHVLGFGHRVGMSQYGADNLARNGFSYQVILQYYYQNTRIKKLSRASSGQYTRLD